MPQQPLVEPLYLSGEMWVDVLFSTLANSCMGSMRCFVRPTCARVIAPLQQVCPCQLPHLPRKLARPTCHDLAMNEVAGPNEDRASALPSFSVSARSRSNHGTANHSDLNWNTCILRYEVRVSKRKFMGQITILVTASDRIWNVSGTMQKADSAALQTQHHQAKQRRRG